MGCSDGIGHVERRLNALPVSFSFMRRADARNCRHLYTVQIDAANIVVVSDEQSVVPECYSNIGRERKAAAQQISVQRPADPGQAGTGTSLERPTALVRFCNLDGPGKSRDVSRGAMNRSYEMIGCIGYVDSPVAADANASGRVESRLRSISTRQTSLRTRAAPSCKALHGYIGPELLPS